MKDASNAIYNRGFHDGIVKGKMDAENEYKNKLIGIRKDEAGIELVGELEKERITAVYGAWNKIYHYVNALFELLETQEVNPIVSDIINGIKSELIDEYIRVSDDYSEIMFENEAFCEKEMKTMDGKEVK